jgi:hypothetical protein
MKPLNALLSLLALVALIVAAGFVTHSQNAAASTPAIASADVMLSSAMGATPGSVLTKELLAAPIYVTTLLSADAGASQTYQISKQVNYCLQCPAAQTCFKLELWDAGSHTADCSKDMNVTENGFNGTTTLLANQNPYTTCFDSAGRSAIVANQVDGGTVACRLLKNELNIPLAPGR